MKNLLEELRIQEEAPKGYRKFILDTGFKLKEYRVASNNVSYKALKDLYMSVKMKRNFFTDISFGKNNGSTWYTLDFNLKNIDVEHALNLLMKMDDGYEIVKIFVDKVTKYEYYVMTGIQNNIEFYVTVIEDMIVITNGYRRYNGKVFEIV